MPQAKKLNIPAFYRSQAEDLLLFAWIEGIQKVLPTVNNSQSIELFKRHFDLSEDQLGLDTALNSYHRTRDKFYQMQRNGKEI